MESSENPFQVELDHPLPLNTFQAVYLSIYCVVVFILLCCGPCLVTFGVDIDISYSIAIAFAVGFAVVCAAWGFLSTINFLVRVIISTLGTLVCCLSVFVAFSVNSRGSGEAWAFGITPGVAFLITLLPLLWLRLVLGWRISFTNPSTIPLKHQIRFGIKHLLIVTAVFSVIMAVVRLIAIPIQDFFDREMMIVAFIAISAACVGVVTTSVSLANQNLPAVIFGGLLLNTIIIAVEVFLMHFTVGLPNAKFYFISAALNVMTMVVVATALLLLRPIGLRLWTTHGLLVQE